MDWIKNKFFKKDRFFETGHYAQIAAIFLVVFDHWGIFGFDLTITFPFAYVPYLRGGLYTFLMGTAFAASVFIYYQRRNRVTIDKFCPQCGKQLEVYNKFKCTKCGDLNFSNDN